MDRNKYFRNSKMTGCGTDGYNTDNDNDDNGGDDNGHEGGKTRFTLTHCLPSRPDKNPLLSVLVGGLVGGLVGLSLRYWGYGW